MITTGIIIWLALIALDAELNAKIIKKKGISVEGHIVLTIIRWGIGIFWGIIFINPSSMADYWPAFIFQATSFWIVFELVLNGLLGNAWFYYGKTALTDRFFQWAGKWVHLGFKVVAFIAMIWSIVKLYE